MAIQIGAKLDSALMIRLPSSKTATDESRASCGVLCVVVDRAQGRSLTDGPCGNRDRVSIAAAIVYAPQTSHRPVSHGGHSDLAWRVVALHKPFPVWHLAQKGSTSS